MPAAPILYAEDDENDAFLVDYAFKQADIRNPLTVAPDGKVAIAYLEGSEPYSDRDIYPMPCLVLLDLKMPGHSGLDVLKWIRAQPTIANLPVLMLTSSNQESDIHTAYSLGANGYLEKPRNPKEMLLMAKAIKDFWLKLNRPPEPCADSKST
jgi:CheY-like chemotaxis protein